MARPGRSPVVAGARAVRGHRVAVVSGDGLVGRSEHGVLVVHGHPDAIDALLADQPLASREGVDALRRTAADGLPDGIVGLVVAVTDDGAIEVTAAGPEHVSVDSAEPLSELRGQARVSRIRGGGRVRLGVAVGRVGAAHDLRGGVVPGAGVELIAVPASQEPDIAPHPTAAQHPAQAPHPAAVIAANPPVPAPPVEVSDQASGHPADAAAGEHRGPAPTTLPHPVSDTAELVEGIVCARQHFNNPLARYCQVCGISMVQPTHDLVERPRPTLGSIVFDDGTTVPLDRSYVIGREPPDEGATRLTPLVVDDDEHSVSRAHAELRLVDWQVVLRDLNSSNGTHVWDTQSSSWRKMPAGEQTTLDAGTYAAVGRRVFVYQPAVRR
jgi:FHA domain